MILMTHILYQEGTFLLIVLEFGWWWELRHTMSMCELSQYKKIYLQKHTQPK